VDFTEGGKPRRAYFAQLGGAGFDSCALEKVEWKWKKRSGMLAYGLAVLRAKLATPRLVTAAAQEHRASGELVLVGNGRYYAGRAPVFPHGDPRDGLLEVRVFPQVGWFTLFAFAWARVSQRPFRVRGESSFQAGSLMLTSTERVPFELEGDNVGCLPATFSVLRQALRVIVK
jgi:diacylglycerol kinase family enzyme